MQKKCYVIMPYGGKEQSQIDRFNTVYQLYMLLPAMNFGFEVIREDIQAQQGSITTNIVRNLATADLVIADLSNSNWNVAYELGIRHVLSRGHTVLLCDNATNLTFDIRGINVIRYNAENPAENMFVIQESIRKAITTRLSQSMTPDNIVHETYEFAHEKLIDYLLEQPDDYSNKIAELKKRCDILEGENQQLRDTIENTSGHFGIQDSSTDISQKIRDAISNMQYSGDNVVLKLRQAFAKQEPNFHEIQDILQQALTEGYLTESNFRSMFHLLKVQGQPQLTNLVLEVAEQRYPTSLDFKSYLADAYSNDYRTQNKAIQYADEVLEVKIVDGKRISSCRKIDSDQLGACMNAYIGVRRFDIMIELIPQLINQLPEQRELLLRNLSTAYREVGDNTAQLETLQQLLADYPMSDINHYRVFTYLRKTNHDQDAFCHLEIASALDPDDTDYLFALSGAIMDTHFCRTENRLLERLARKNDCAKAALPYLMQAMQASPDGRTIQKCMDFILRNGLSKYVDIFKNWIENGMLMHEIPDLNYHGIVYLESLGAELNDESCNRIFIYTTENEQSC